MDSDQEKTINEIIHEYLAHSKYPLAMAAFEKESESKGLAIPSNSNQQMNEERISNIQNLFLLAMKEGDRASFFSLWDSHFNESLRSSDSLFQKIEFSMSIFFAVFPIHEHVPAATAKNSSLEYTMDQFKQYLETRGAPLCKSQSHLCYYALPYVPDPKNHASFKDLFTETWIRELEERLLKFLGQSLSGQEGSPRIVKLLGGLDVQQTEEFKKQIQEARDLKRKLQAMTNLEKDMNKKHRQLQSDYHGLITIASELVQSLVSCIHGQKVSPTYLASICQRLATLKGTSRYNAARGYPASPAIPHHPATGPILSRPLHELNRPASAQLGSYPTQAFKRDDGNDKELDFATLKEDLSSRDPQMAHKQALLLQALRQRLVKAPMGRKIVLQDFAKHDILKLGHDSNIVDSMLQSSEVILQEQLSKLMNVMASDCSGREYLLNQSCRLVPSIITAFKSQKQDTPVRQNLLGVLQKLSLRRASQSIMIQNGWIEYLLSLFEDLENLSEYTIEYGSALLMNLCLRTQGKKVCLQDPSRTLRILNELIEHDNLQVKTYVNGTLFSIFSEPGIREEARAIGMEDQLRYLKEASDEQLTKQIDFLLEKLNSDEIVEEAPSEDGDEHDDMEEDDDSQTVMDEDDPDELVRSPDENGGEELLAMYRRTLLPPSSFQQSNQYLQQVVLPEPVPIPPYIPEETLQQSDPDVHYSPNPIERLPPGTEELPDMIPPISPRAQPLPVIVPPMKPKGKIPKNPEEKTEFVAAFTTRPKIPRTPQSTTPVPYDEPYSRGNTHHDLNDRLGMLKSTSRMSLAGYGRG